MPNDEAKQQYVALVRDMDIGWQAGSSNQEEDGGGGGEDREQKKSGGMGPVFSSFANADQGECDEDSLHDLASRGELAALPTFTWRSYVSDGAVQRIADNAESSP